MLIPCILLNSSVKFNCYDSRLLLRVPKAMFMNKLSAIFLASLSLFVCLCVCLLIVFFLVENVAFLNFGDQNTGKSAQ